MNNKSALYGAVSTIAVLTTWFYALKFAPSEEHMGEVYRIIYLHVPSAITAFLSSFVLFIFSVAALRKSAVNASIWARATAEVGLLFTILTLATGSIWGRPTWGVWWTWDARLTTTLLLALLYAGYLILYHSMEAGKSRDKALSILGILIFADVPIIYKSVSWWRTLHQPPSILRREGSTMAPEMLSTLGMCFAAMVMMASFLIYMRFKNLKLSEEIEEISLSSL